MPDLPTSKAGIETLPLPDKNAIDYRDQKQRALWLRVSPAGTKSWCVRYKQDGKSQRENIGRFPEVTITLAREKASETLARISKGTNLIAERAAAREVSERQARETVKVVGELYFERVAQGRHRMNGRPKRASSIRVERIYFDRFVVPRIGNRRMADLKRAELQAMMDEISEEASPSSGRHTRNVLHRIFTFAIWQDIVIADPTMFVATEACGERDRVLSDDEIRSMWQCLDGISDTPSMRVSSSTILAIKLATVTLQRRGEVVGMSVDEIDRAAKIWTIPANRTKNGRAHIVPLTDLALRLIDEALSARVGKVRNSRFLFPSPRNPEKSMRAVAMNIAWYRSVVYSPTPSRITEDGRQRITPHDLRRTGATNMTGERIGIPRFIVSQVLNHTSDTGGASAVTAVYDRNAYLVEKRRALEAWSDLLLEIVGEKVRSTNVVQMVR